MRVRTLLIVSLGLLLVAGVSQSMAQSPTPSSPVPTPAQRQEASPSKTTEMRIFTLEHYPMDQLAELLSDVMRGRAVTIVLDERSNRLIVKAFPEDLAQIENAIRALDVPNARGPQAQQMMYRVYMLELPSKHLGLRPFSIMMMGSAQLPRDRVLTAGNGNDVQIESFSQHFVVEGLWQFAIGGRAASNEAIERLTKSISDCQIMELEWEDDTPVMPTTRVPPLPESLQEHIRKFLGEGTGIAGYWFGNLSVPGTIRAPIGPWVLQMQVDRSTQENEVELEIAVVRGGEARKILSNSIRGMIERPVIIGYNRDNRGVQTMGALVIVPEMDTPPAGGTSETKSR